MTGGQVLLQPAAAMGLSYELVQWCFSDSKKGMGGGGAGGAFPRPWAKGAEDGGGSS